jgi:hypothetical protein
MNDQLFESIGYPAVSGRIGSRIKKGIKKVGKAVVKAHTVPFKAVAKAHVKPFRMIVGYDDGVLVAQAPEVGVIEGVDLVAHARGMAARGEIVASGELYEYLGSLGGPPEVSGKIAKKIKKGVKKVAKKVVKAATKVAQSKVVKGVYNVVKKVVPQPFKAGLTVAEKGVSFAKKAAKKGSKEAKAAPIVKQLVQGKITPAAATKAAAKLGVNGDDVKAAAITVKMKEAADQGDEGAATVMDAVEKIEGSPSEAVTFGAEAAIRKQFPSAQVMTVTDGSGQKRLTAVIPL